MYRINELVRAAKEWQPATVLKYASPSHPREAPGRGDRVQLALRKRGERVHWGPTSVAGWPVAAFGAGRRKVGAAWAM